MLLQEEAMLSPTFCSLSSEEMHVSLYTAEKHGDGIFYRAKILFLILFSELNSYSTRYQEQF